MGCTVAKDVQAPPTEEAKEVAPSEEVKGNDENPPRTPPERSGYGAYGMMYGGYGGRLPETPDPNENVVQDMNDSGDENTDTQKDEKPEMLPPNPAVKQDTVVAYSRYCSE